MSGKGKGGKGLRPEYEFGYPRHITFDKPGPRGRSKKSSYPHKVTFKTQGRPTLKALKSSRSRRRPSARTREYY